VQITFKMDDFQPASSYAPKVYIPTLHSINILRLQRFTWRLISLFWVLV